MTNGPLAVTKLAPVCGMSHAALKSYVKPLVRERHVRPSRPGGGKGTVHLDHVEHAMIVLATTSPGPERALEAVQAIGALPPLNPQPGDYTSLLGWLAGEIAQVAHRILRREPPNTSLADADWALYTCLDPLRAWVSWTKDGQEHKRIFAHSSAPPRRGVWFLGRIDSHVLEVAGELYADTIKQTAPQRETAALAGAAVTSRSRRTTPETPVVPKGGPTEFFGWPQGRHAHAPVKHKKVRSNNHGRPNSAAVVGG